jgi:hypothetical protein
MRGLSWWGLAPAWTTLRLAPALACSLVACKPESASGLGPIPDAAATEASLTFFTDVSDASMADEPAVACTQDGSIDECALPPTFCADAVHATVYAASQCLSGFCRWTVETVDCAVFDGGACIGAEGGVVGGSSDAGEWVPVSSLCAVPAPPAPDPPSMACGPDAGAPADVECPLPPSVCTGAGTLVYYDNGTCVSGACTWQSHYHFCSSTCANGACIYLGTK